MKAASKKNATKTATKTAKAKALKAYRQAIFNLCLVESYAGEDLTGTELEGLDMGELVVRCAARIEAARMSLAEVIAQGDLTAEEAHAVLLDEEREVELPECRRVVAEQRQAA